MFSKCCVRFPRCGRFKDLSAPFQLCWSCASDPSQSDPNMRIHSASEGLSDRINNHPNPRGIAAGGWLRGTFQRFRRQPNPDVKTPSSEDKQPSSFDGKRPVVIPTFERLLEERHLHEASLLLIDRENHLFGEITEEEALKHHAEEVDKLAEDRKALETVLWETVQRSLSLSSDETDDAAVLASAVKAIYREEEQDQLWKHVECRSPSNWKKRHDSILRELVESRMDNPLLVSLVKEKQSSIQSDIHCMGRQLKEDLLIVVQVVKSCYPPEADICNFYAAAYHRALSARLKKIAEFVLEDTDCTSLLRWVNHYYPGILQKPELASEIDDAALGKLLPNELLEPLEEQYLTREMSELSLCMSQVLENDIKKWSQGEEPMREDGCYTSHLAYDIIQFINGIVTRAETTTGSLHKAQTTTCQLTDLLQRFKSFQEDIIKQNRSNSKAHIKANLGCIEQFRDVLQRKKHLFTADVQQNCLSVLTDMKQSAHVYLLSPVHKVLKPQYQKLGTSDWLKKNAFDKLQSSIEKELQDLQGLVQPCQEELIGQLHQEVTVQYVKRLLRGDVKLKDREQQHWACATVMDNAESLQMLFSKMGSKEIWLKEILTTIAEVLKLQDIPAIQMQVVSMVSAHPDLSERHISALLKLKTNLSKAERRTVKATLVDALKAIDSDVHSRPFFSKVEVR
ncbi:tumor necrosis factor alpha-induced protein 2 isoform 1-T1 [Menidia menidia]